MLRTPEIRRIRFGGFRMGLEKEEGCDARTEIPEFVRRRNLERTDQTKTLKRKRRKRTRYYRRWIRAALLLLNLAAVICCAMFLLQTSLLLAVLVPLLETALALCLCRAPLWFHGLILAAHLLACLLVPMPVFLLLAGEAYLLPVLVLREI